MTEYIKLQKRLPNLTPEEEQVFTEAINEAYLRGKADAMKWIPVTERLPEKKGNYLGFTGSAFMVGYYKGNAVWWIWSKDVEGVDLFTHWMPLPEPPKGE